MATKNKRVEGSWWIFILVTTLYTIVHGHVEGLQTLDKSKFGPKPKGTVKTIEVPEDGDMIDCVDIYKQPGFDKLLVKDLKMAPSNSYLSLFNKTGDSQPKLIQNWHKYGECAKGTIPIRRTWISETVRRKTPNYIERENRELAIGFQRGSTYHGGGSMFNLWNPEVRRGSREFSSSQMWLYSSRGHTLNAIEAGWTVNPEHYHDSKTRIFIYWTRDGYNSTGCPNRECDGFVQTDRRVVLGGSIGPISVYGGHQSETHISVIKDWKTNCWWLQTNGVNIGFFPHSLFTSLDIGADSVEFGGDVLNLKPSNRHTSTQMGSGHFTSEKFGKASYMRNVVVVNREFEIVDASLNIHATRPNCYSLDFGPPGSNWKTHYYYGGPGYSRVCPS